MRIIEAQRARRVEGVEVERIRKEDKAWLEEWDEKGQGRSEVEQRERDARVEA